MKYYIVDAFASALFKGNPAGVCLLNEKLDEQTMQNIAVENNLSETAFLLKNQDDYELRWFTPEYEIDLCGHATLASAFVVLKIVEPKRTKVRFHTMSGILTVTKSEDKFIMDFPSRKPVPAQIPPNLDIAIGAKIKEAFQSRDLLVVVENEEVVGNLSPDIGLINKFSDIYGIIVTAKGSSCDFVSRYLTPNVGISEDPVTGSAHATLIPFWSERLDKKVMFAKQLSARGGALYCKDCGERVEICGEAILYLSGEIRL